MSFLTTKKLIPLESRQAVSKGWSHTKKPMGVTWHWTATWDLSYCDKLLGGSNALRKGKASAHYGVGTKHSEGISQYVELENRSWHAGSNQILRWDGQTINHDGTWSSGSRTTIGVETVNIGFARAGIYKKTDWQEVWSPGGKNQMWVPEWPDEQIDMMISVGKEIIAKYPNIQLQDHHGHHDICPGYKEDPSFLFPFAKVLSGIYDQCIPDVWLPFLKIASRQQALITLGYNLGKWGADGDWGRMSDDALKDFQKDQGMPMNGYWTTFVCWKIYDEYQRRNLDFKF